MLQIAQITTTASEVADAANTSEEVKRSQISSDGSLQNKKFMMVAYDKA